MPKGHEGVSEVRSGWAPKHEPVRWTCRLVHDAHQAHDDGRKEHELLDRVVVEEPSGQQAEYGRTVDFALKVEQVLARLLAPARLNVGDEAPDARVRRANERALDVRLEHIFESAEGRGINAKVPDGGR